MDKPDQLVIYCADHPYYLAQRPPGLCGACQFIFKLKKGEISVRGVVVERSS